MPSKSLSEYRTQLKTDGWHTLPDDGYIYDNLVNLLVNVDKEDELKALFETDSWLQARLRQSDFAYEPYLSDLQIAWDSKIDEFRQQVDSGESPNAFVNLFRYALVESRFNSIIEHLPPMLISQAVKHGLWSVERAIYLAEKSQSLELYALLLESGKLPRYIADKFVEEAYERVVYRRDHWFEEDVPWWPPSATIYGFMQDLLPMLPHFSREQQIEALSFDLKHWLGYGWGKAGFDPNVVKQASPYFTQEQVDELIHLVLTESIWEGYTPHILAHLLGRLESEQQHQIAEKSLQQLLDGGSREIDKIQGIAKLIPFLDDENRDKMIDTGIRRTSKMQDNGNLYRVSSWILYLQYVHDEWRKEFVEHIFKVATTIQRGFLPVTQLTKLYKYLDEEKQEYVIQRVLELPQLTGEHLSTIVIDLYPHLSTTDQERVLVAAFERAEFELEQKNSSYQLHNLLPILVSEHLQRAIALILNVIGRNSISEFVGCMLSMNSASSQSDFACWLENNRKGGIYSQEYATYLPDDEIEEVYRAILAFPLGISKRDRLAPILPRLTKAQHEHLIQEILGISWHFNSKWLSDLTSLCHLFHPELRSGVAKIVLDARVWGSIPQEGLEQVTDENKRQDLVARNRHVSEWELHSFANILPFLSDEDVSRAYDYVRNIVYKLPLAHCLLALLERLTSEQKQEAVDKIYQALREKEFKSPYSYDLLEQAVPYFSPKQIKAILHYAENMVDIPHTGYLIRTISPRLDEEMKVTAYQNYIERAIRFGIDDDYVRAGVLSLLAPHLDEPLLTQATDVIRADIIDKPDRNLARQLTILNRLAMIDSVSIEMKRHIWYLLIKSLDEQKSNSTETFLIYMQVYFAELSEVIINAEIADSIVETMFDVCLKWEWI